MRFLAQPARSQRFFGARRVISSMRVRNCGPRSPKDSTTQSTTLLPCVVGYLVVLSFSPNPAAKPTVEKAVVAYLKARGVRIDASMKNSSPEGRCATTSMIASREFRCSSGSRSLGSQLGSVVESCWNSGMGTSRLTRAPVCLFEGSREEHSDGGVKKGDATTNFAREGVEVRGSCNTFPTSVCDGPSPGTGWPRRRAVTHWNSESVR